MGLLGKLVKQRPKVDLADIIGEELLPTFPALVTRALDELRKPEPEFRKVGEFLERDPTLTVRLLNLVNSSTFAMRNDVRSAQHAVTLLGQRQVESLLIACSLGHVVPRSPESDRWRLACWRVSARRAVIAGKLAEVVAPRQRGECFTAGLIEDVAIPILAQRRAGTYLAVLEAAERDGTPLHQVEADAFGWDHAHVGGLCAKHWNLPDPLRTAVLGHHDEPDLEGHDELRLAQVVADLREDDTDAEERTVERARDVLGVEADRTVEILESAADEVEAIANLLA